MPVLQTALDLQLLQSAGPAQTVSRTLRDRSGDMASVLDFNIALDGLTDATAAINDAWSRLVAAGRRPVLAVPPSTGGLRIAGTLTPPAGAGLVGLFGRPLVRWIGTAALWSASQPYTILEDLTFLGDHLTTGYAFNYAAGADYAVVRNVHLENWNGGFTTAAKFCKIQLTGKNVRGAGVRIDGGQHNETDIVVTNATSFGTYLTNEARFNVVRRSTKLIDLATLTAWQQANYASDIALGKFGIEAVGITESCSDNQIDYYYAENTGDAACSISGVRNHITLGVGIGCEGNALTMIGSRNSAETIFGEGNKRGVAFIPTAGGLTKDNRVGRVVAINNWFAGVSQEKTQIRPWVSGATYSTETNYCSHQLRNYRILNGGSASFGTIPPTHTSGTVSDGLVNLEFVSSDPVTLDPDRNVVESMMLTGNGLGRAGGTGLLYDGSGFNLFVEAGQGGKLYTGLHQELASSVGWTQP
jgi:hypothetical protein